MNNIKRYLIFAYTFYEAEGGMDDCIGKTDTIKAAHEIIEEARYTNVLAQRDVFIIYDLLEDKEV
ncbi:unnamed protein product, partial [marine sediment metagenome]